jgi:hypothetical protein
MKPWHTAVSPNKMWKKEGGRMELIEAAKLFLTLREIGRPDDLWTELLGLVDGANFSDYRTSTKWKRNMELIRQE